MVEVFNKENKLIDDASIARGNFILVKCYIRYWKHYTSNCHKLTLELTIIKQLIKSKLIIKDNNNSHRFIIYINL
jgi:hypothetical protein